MVSNPADRAGSQQLSGRCEIFEEIGSGGMATIHLGRLIGAGSFVKTVAVKRLHPQLTRSKEFTQMLLREAQLVARIQHANVLPVLDLVEEENELFIVMEYVEGEAFHKLMQAAYSRQEPVPLPIIMTIMCGVLHGLHGAHEAKDAGGKPLELVHRDVAPDNIIVGVDGVARLLDFGVAKALGQYHATGDGTIKGKLAYMTPEQVLGEELDRRTDIFSAMVVMWQAMTGCKLFSSKDTASAVHAILYAPIQAPSKVKPGLPPELDHIVLRGLDRDRSRRWDNALQLAETLEAAAPLAAQHEVGKWVRRLAAEQLRETARKVAALEATPIGGGSDKGVWVIGTHHEPWPAAGIESSGIRGVAAGEAAPATAQASGQAGARRLRWPLLAAAGGVAAIAIIGLTAAIAGDDEPTAAPTPPAVGSAAAAASTTAVASGPPEAAAQSAARASAAAEPAASLTAEPAASTTAEPATSTTAQPSAAPTTPPSLRPWATAKQPAPGPGPGSLPQPKPKPPAKPGPDSMYSQE